MREEQQKREEALEIERKKARRRIAPQIAEDFMRKLEGKTDGHPSRNPSKKPTARRSRVRSKSRAKCSKTSLEILTRNFPTDLIEDVPTGIRGADLVHKVRDPYSRELGVILCVRKIPAFAADWIKKLKDDRVLAKADVCILVSSVLPEGVRHFGLYEGVWVTEPEYFLPFTTHALRDKILALAEQGKAS